MSGEKARLGLDGLAWFKSSYSGGECVEVAVSPAMVHIRDSKDTTHVVLAVKPTVWTEFVEFAALGQG
ncbi:DUF397 domain-containing protein [Streptomyces sp. NPDC005921]|uniref:DUF397 domain-containing protein n=1 Tax=Streptomyces sp. NPDC005827 TaxID=3157070 RepID=UPI003409F7A0